MKRHKRRRSSGTVRCLAAGMLPVAAAAAVHGAFGIRDSLFSADKLTVSYSEKAAAPHNTDSETISRIVREDELLEGKMTLSEGYGVCDERPENQEYLRLADPRDMRADDAGAVLGQEAVAHEGDGRQQNDEDEQVDDADLAPDFPVLVDHDLFLRFFIGFKN